MLSVGLSDCEDMAPGGFGTFDGACARANPDTTQAIAATIARCFTALEDPQPVVGMWKPADTASRAGQRAVIAFVLV